MDLLIKDLGITDRPITLVLYPNGDVDHLTEDNRYETIAKAIELPPHGEAKDTDIAIRYIKDEMEDDFNETTTFDEKSYKEGMKRAIELIGYAPTVLEASDGCN